MLFKRTGKFRAAVLGSGNIGTDLAIKIKKSKSLNCEILIGRNLGSPGIARARAEDIPVAIDGVSHILTHPDKFDIVFDATSADSHHNHAAALEAAGLFVINLTPAKRGVLCVPSVNLEDGWNAQNVNMVTCGGQASSPVVHALGVSHREINYIEVVSSISSASAGPATRSNIDDYIHVTETAIKKYSNSRRSKAILNLNPAVPCVNMQTTVLAQIDCPDMDLITENLQLQVKKVREYVPGYEILVWPRIVNGRIFTMVRVVGSGDYLPPYAGNLDIINCAAIKVAEEYVNNFRQNFDSRYKQVAR